MSSSMRTSTLLYVQLIATLLLGCASERHKDVHGPLSPPPSESLRGELGTVRVVSSLAQPGVTFVVAQQSGLSSRLSGAGTGARLGAMVGCAIWSPTYDGLGTTASDENPRG